MYIRRRAGTQLGARSQEDRATRQGASRESGLRAQSNHRDMPALHIDLQVRQRTHQLRVKRTDSIQALIMLGPRLIIVLRSIAEGAENTLKIMLVLKSNVPLNNWRYEPPICLSESVCLPQLTLDPSPDLVNPINTILLTVVLDYRKGITRNVQAPMTCFAVQPAWKLACRVVRNSVEYAIGFDLVDDAHQSWPTLLIFAKAILRPHQASQKSTSSG